MENFLEYTDINEIPATVNSLRSSFVSGSTRSLEYRINQLKQLAFMVQDNVDSITEAIKKDLGRPEPETHVVEIHVILAEINHVLKNLLSWTKPRNVKTSVTWLASSPKVRREPKGVVLIISPFNYPLALALLPVVGAISAGNCAVLKPSELCPHSSTLYAQLFPHYMDPNSYKVVNGGVSEAKALLDLKWDHIFYTGSANVGRAVATAAAKNLTPVTLELGGKCATIVMPDCDIKIAASRIVWGKAVNSGQTCIAPDYILCHHSIEKRLLQEIENTLRRFYPQTSGSTLESTDFGSIIAKHHMQRLQNSLRSTKGKTVIGGKSDEEKLKLEFTVVTELGQSDSLMKDEIFGPILPVLTFEDTKEVIKTIQERDSPLAIYIFTSDRKKADYVRSRTQSGCFMINDVVIQNAITELPFGGVGNSGYGTYHGKRSFDTFTYERSEANNPTWLEKTLAGRYPPYNPSKLIITRLLQGAFVSGKRPHPIGVSDPVWQDTTVTNPYMDFFRLLRGHIGRKTKRLVRDKTGR